MRNLHYKYYLLGILTIIATFNYLDRYILSLLVEPIKTEFDLMDWQMGLLSGLAFAVFYALAGIPIARWADNGDRNAVVTITTGLWSVMVVLCGFTNSFFQLLLVRVGVGVGEAGCLPPAQSLLAEEFDRDERPRAMSIYWICGYLAMLIGFMGGGWFASEFGWRATFICAGLPGVALAFLARVTIKERRRHSLNPSRKQHPSFLEVINILRARRTFRNIAVAFCVAYFFSAGIIQWLPTFFIRSHGMGLGEIGVWMAASVGGGGILGSLIGGVIVEKFALRNETKQLRWVAATFVSTGILFFLVFFSEKEVALVCMCLMGVSMSLCNGPVLSVIQSLVDDNMRAISLAIIFLFCNLFGLGLGPIVTGAISDILAPSMGVDSLKYALAAMTPGFVLTAFFYWKAADSVERDIYSVAYNGKEQNNFPSMREDV